MKDVKIELLGTHSVKGETPEVTTDTAEVQFINTRSQEKLLVFKTLTSTPSFVVHLVHEKLMILKKLKQRMERDIVATDCGAHGMRSCEN
jgi:hypothetical protein